MDLSNENIIHIKKNEIEYIQFKKLNELGLKNCYSLKVKNVDFRRNFPEEQVKIVKNSYKKICDCLNIDEKTIVRPYQSHTDCIQNVENCQQKFDKVDGLVTDKENITLMLTYADCTPILLYDPVKCVIGNIHSGWRGTVQRIGAKGIKKLIDEYGSNPKDIIACIGPCIRKCHFEVNEDVKAIFEKEFNEYTKKYDIIQKKREKYYIDTTLINKLILRDCGLKTNNIIDSKICTVCNSDLIHSHRAGKDKAGRNVAIIVRS